MTHYREPAPSSTSLPRSTAQARRASVTQLIGGSSAPVHMISLHAIRGVGGVLCGRLSDPVIGAGSSPATRRST